MRAKVVKRYHAPNGADCVTPGKVGMGQIVSTGAGLYA